MDKTTEKVVTAIEFDGRVYNIGSLSDLFSLQKRLREIDELMKDFPGKTDND
jgi:hypothetical protein